MTKCFYLFIWMPLIFLVWILEFISIENSKRKQSPYKIQNGIKWSIELKQANTKLNSFKFSRKAILARRNFYILCTRVCHLSIHIQSDIGYGGISDFTFIIVSLDLVIFFFIIFQRSYLSHSFICGFNSQLTARTISRFFLKKFNEQNCALRVCVDRWFFIFSKFKILFG